MIGYDIDRFGRAFQVVSPTLESFEYGHKFLVVNVVVKLGRSESSGVEGNRVYLAFRGSEREYHGESVIRGICLYYQGLIRDPMS